MTQTSLLDKCLGCQSCVHTSFLDMTTFWKPATFWINCTTWKPYLFLILFLCMFSASPQNSLNNRDHRKSWWTKSYMQVTTSTGAMVVDPYWTRLWTCKLSGTFELAPWWLKLSTPLWLYSRTFCRWGVSSVVLVPADFTLAVLVHKFT